jgi:hypothetical protein
MQKDLELRFFKGLFSVRYQPEIPQDCLSCDLFLTFRKITFLIIMYIEGGGVLDFIL